MDIELVNKIKRIAIIALASDDNLVENLVLKGGNAIDLLNRNTNSISRASYDLDYSIENGDFSEPTISDRIEKTLQQTFLEHDFVIFDYRFFKKPKETLKELNDFWGGYRVQFKIIEKGLFDMHKSDINKLRKSATTIYPNNSTVFELEFSKYEYTKTKRELEIDGYKIYIYTPEMIVFEKVRAICQQLPRYNSIVPSFSPRARAKDFFDIYLIMEEYPIDVTFKDNIELLKNIFTAKKVPVNFIKDIRNNKALHKDDWDSVVDTVPSDAILEEFDFYFDFVVNTFEAITIP